MKRLVCGSLCAFALLVAQAGRSQQPTFTYGVEDTAGSATVADIQRGTSSTVTKALRGILTTENAPDVARGAQGWSVSLKYEHNAGGTDFEVLSATTDGTVAAPVPVGLRLGVSFELTETTTGADNIGCVSAVVLALIEDVVLPGEGTAHILNFEIQGRTPDVAGECNPARLVYQNGLVGSGQPVENNITWEGGTVLPILGDESFGFCALEGEADCTNGLDDDEDGLADCRDPDCSDDPACPENCTDGEDNDTDGAVDCADSECAGNPPCPVPEVNCLNGTDDDEDGLTDCDDPDCPAEQCDCADDPINVFFQDGIVSGPGGLAQVPDLFANIQTRLEVAPGANTVYAGITMQNADAGLGIQGWSLSIPIVGATPTAATTEGTIAAAAGEGSPGIRLGVSFELTEVTATSPEHADNDGAVSAVVFALIEDVATDPVGTVTALRIDLDVPDPAAGQLSCRDGLVGSGQPVENLFTVGGESANACGCFGLTLAPLTVAPEVPFIRGDPNDDAKNNIADAVWIVNELFRGGPETLCQDAADANDDGMVNLGDAVDVVNYQFRHGAPPPSPFPGCGVDPTDDTGDEDDTNDLPCPPGSVAACP